jgi:hypothetical protein
MQQYDRRLTENGLSLVFHTHRNGQPVRRIETELLRR